jgi:hypothetical protein
MGSFANGEIIVSDSLSNINELDSFKALKFDLLIVDDTMMSIHMECLVLCLKNIIAQLFFTYILRKILLPVLIFW